MSSHTVIRGAAHANAMRADKMRALAVKLVGPLSALVEAGRGDSPTADTLQSARAALVDAQEAGVVP